MRAIDDPNRYDTQNCRVYRVNVETGGYKQLKTGLSTEECDRFVASAIKEYTPPCTLYSTNDRDVSDDQKIKEFCQFIRGGK